MKAERGGGGQGRDIWIEKKIGESSRCSKNERDRERRESERERETDGNRGSEMEIGDNRTLTEEP